MTGDHLTPDDEILMAQIRVALDLTDGQTIVAFTQSGVLVRPDHGPTEVRPYPTGWWDLVRRSVST